MRYQERGIYGTVLACVPFLLADAFIVQRGVESSADGESSLITVLITLLLLEKGSGLCVLHPRTFNI